MVQRVAVMSFSDLPGESRSGSMAMSPSNISKEVMTLTTLSHYPIYILCHEAEAIPSGSGMGIRPHFGCSSDRSVPFFALILGKNFLISVKNSFSSICLRERHIDHVYSCHSATYTARPLSKRLREVSFPGGLQKVTSFG